MNIMNECLITWKLLIGLDKKYLALLLDLFIYFSYYACLFFKNSFFGLISKIKK